MAAFQEIDKLKSFDEWMGKIPGRVHAEDAARILGFSDHDIPVLVRHKMLTPLGDPSVKSTKYFAAVEIFTKLTTGGESDILIAKNNSMFLLTGTNPDSWTVTQISDDVGCPAPYTFKASPIGLEFAQLQSKQVVVWQSENGIMLYDSTAIFPISDTISNYFDQSKSESINLDKIAEGYGFWDNSSGVYEYHWLFASGNSTTINKELVFEPILEDNTKRGLEIKETSV